MQAPQEKTLLQISVPSHRQDILKVFKDLVEAFRGDVKLEDETKKDSSKKSILDYAGTFSGGFSENINYKKIRENKANKIWKKFT